MAAVPDTVRVHVTTNLIRPAQVVKLRELVDRAKFEASDRDQPFLMGCMAAVEDQIDEMFGVDR